MVVPLFDVKILMEGGWGSFGLALKETGLLDFDGVHPTIKNSLCQSRVAEIPCTMIHYDCNVNCDTALLSHYTTTLCQYVAQYCATLDYHAGSRIAGGFKGVYTFRGAQGVKVVPPSRAAIPRPSDRGIYPVKSHCFTLAAYIHTSNSHHRGNLKVLFHSPILAYEFS